MHIYVQLKGPLAQVILDLGRRPEARFLGKAGGQYLRDNEVGQNLSLFKNASEARSPACPLSRQCDFSPEQVACWQMLCAPDLIKQGSSLQCNPEAAFEDFGVEVTAQMLRDMRMHKRLSESASTHSCSSTLET